MTRATLTTKTLVRPANLYASLPAVNEANMSQEEVDYAVRQAERANVRKLVLAQQAEAREARTNKIIATVAVVSTAVLVVCLFLLH